MKVAEIVIIGAGPAGITAAVQLRRAGFSPVVFEKAEIGGLLHEANYVENYPGFPNGIAGRDLAELLKGQFERFEIETINYEVKKIDLCNGCFSIDTSAGEFTANIVIIASGTVPKAPEGIIFGENVERKVHRGVLGLENVVGERIAILGAGDAAFDYALNLARRNEIVILGRGSEPKCLPLLFQRAVANPHIEYYRDYSASSVSRKEGRLNIEGLNDALPMGILADRLLIAIGRIPAEEFLSIEIKKLKEEFVKKGSLYFIGDVVNGDFRQLSIAVGDGMRAAMSIIQRAEKDLGCG